MTCDYEPCSNTIRPGELMCRRHWYALPPDLRSEINDLWRRRRVDPYNVLVVEQHERAKQRATEFLEDHEPGRAAR